MGEPLLNVLCAHPVVMAGGLVVTCAMLGLAVAVLIDARWQRKGATLRGQVDALKAERDRLLRRERDQDG